MRFLLSIQFRIHKSAMPTETSREHPTQCTFINSGWLLSSNQLILLRCSFFRRSSFSVVFFVFFLISEFVCSAKWLEFNSAFYSIVLLEFLMSPPQLLMYTNTYFVWYALLCVAMHKALCMLCIWQKAVTLLFHLKLDGNTENL